jgi:hypothetical protein
VRRWLRRPDVVTSPGARPGIRPGNFFWSVGGGTPGAVTDPPPEPELPAAPSLSIVEPVTNPPAFDVDLPSGNGDYRDAAVADVLRIQITIATDTGFASVVDEVTDTLDSGDLTADVIEVAGLDTLAAGNYIARARLERSGVGNSAWSAATASFAVPSAKSFTFRGSHDYQDFETAVSFPMDIGTAAADRLVIVGAASGNSASAISGVTVNGVSLTQAVSDQVGGGGSELWSGLVTTGSGSQTVVVTWASGAYLQRGMMVWTAEGLASNTAKATSANQASLAVDASDFLFTMVVGDFGTSSSPPSLAAYTQPPTEHTTTSTDFGFTGGDETVASTNASFGTTGTSFAASVAATFA